MRVYIHAHTIINLQVLLLLVCCIITVGFSGPNSGPHAYKTSILLIEPSPQLRFIFFNIFFYYEFDFFFNPLNTFSLFFDYLKS